MPLCAWKKTQTLEVKLNSYSIRRRLDEIDIRLLYLCKFTGAASLPMKLNVWRTIPYVEDEYVSGTKAALPLSVLA